MIERKTLSSKICYILIIAVVLLFSLSCLLPLIYTLALSLSSKEAVAAGQVGFWPVGFTLVNYKEILYLIFNYPHKYYTFKYFKV